MADQLFIRNGTILTMEEDSPVIKNGSLWVENGEILGVGRNGSIAIPPGARVVVEKGQLMGSDSP